MPTLSSPSLLVQSRKTRQKASSSLNCLLPSFRQVSILPMKILAEKDTRQTLLPLISPIQQVLRVLMRLPILRPILQRLHQCLTLMMERELREFVLALCPFQMTFRPSPLSFLQFGVQSNRRRLALSLPTDSLLLSKNPTILMHSLAPLAT